MNIRPKTEQERIVEILMKLSEEDRKELLGYMGEEKAWEFLFLMKEYDPYWPTQGCEA
tara:strand:- start:230 stop:403 length:174 start_codon:yes stop_codon:yes gene_type:complete